MNLFTTLAVYLQYFLISLKLRFKTAFLFVKSNYYLYFNKIFVELYICVNSASSMLTFFLIFLAILTINIISYITKILI